MYSRTCAPCLVRWASVNPAAALSGDLEIRRLRATIDNPVEACVRFLEKSPTDMIVVSASGHERETSWLRRPLAEDLSRKAGEVTLFLPAGAAGFVGPEDGKGEFAHHSPFRSPERPRPQPALEAARRLMVSVPQVAGTALVLHVGPRSDMPEIELPSVAGWSWKKINLEGDVAEKILQTADENKADVISMATAGHHGFLDALRGSTTMQVLRGALRTDVDARRLVPRLNGLKRRSGLMECGAHLTSFCQSRAAAVVTTSRYR